MNTVCVYETEKIKVLVESERRRKPDSKISQTRADKSGSKQHQRQTDQWQVHAEWQIEKLASVGKLATENRRQMCVLDKAETEKFASARPAHSLQMWATDRKLDSRLINLRMQDQGVKGLKTTDQKDIV